MNSSIKRRILTHYLIAISITVFIVGFFLGYAIKEYYYNNIEYAIKEQLNVADTFFTRYLETMPLRKASEDIVDNLFTHTNVQIQIIDENKDVILDTLGVYNINLKNDMDIERAFYGIESTNVMEKAVVYSDDKVMMITRPINSKKTKAAIRVITSLEDVDDVLGSIKFFIFIVEAIVITVIFIISIIISNSIINPLINLNRVAKRIGKGEYTIKAEKTYNDEIGSLADTLNTMSSEILKSERLKNEFISSVSHELKTPLTSIKGWAITLKLKELQSEEMMDKGLNIIIEESERLTDLVNELLDFSRYEAGNISLKIETFNLGQLLRDIYFQMKPRSERNGVSLQYQDIELGDIKADKNRLKQVFINIVDNAIKFSQGGIVKIYSEEKDGYIYIIIEDNGIGIKKNDLKRVKEKFFKGNNDRPGNGIGLAICEEIMKLHNGKIDIDSEIRKGTKVTVRIKKL